MSWTLWLCLFMFAWPLLGAIIMLVLYRRTKRQDYPRRIPFGLVVMHFAFALFMATVSLWLIHEETGPWGFAWEGKYNNLFAKIRLGMPKAEVQDILGPPTGEPPPPPGKEEPPILGSIRAIGKIHPGLDRQCEMLFWHDGGDLCITILFHEGKVHFASLDKAE